MSHGVGGSWRGRRRGRRAVGNGNRKRSESSDSRIIARFAPRRSWTEPGAAEKEKTRSGPADVPICRSTVGVSRGKNARAPPRRPTIGLLNWPRAAKSRVTRRKPRAVPAAGSRPAGGTPSGAARFGRCPPAAAATWAAGAERPCSRRGRVRVASRSTGPHVTATVRRSGRVS